MLNSVSVAKAKNLDLYSNYMTIGFCCRTNGSVEKVQHEGKVEIMLTGDILNHHDLSCFFKPDSIRQRRDTVGCNSGLQLVIRPRSLVLFGRGASLTTLNKRRKILLGNLK
jgi:hypothetical protein